MKTILLGKETPVTKVLNGTLLGRMCFPMQESKLWCNILLKGAAGIPTSIQLRGRAKYESIRMYDNLKQFRRDVANFQVQSSHKAYPAVVQAQEARSAMGTLKEAALVVGDEDIGI